MKKLIFSLALMAATLLSASAQEKTKTYDFGDIKSLNVGYSYQVFVTEGNSDQVKIEYDSKFEDYIKIVYVAESHQLSVTMKENLPKKLTVGHQPRINVYLEMNDISNIDLSGACNVTFEGSFKADELDVELSGASKLNKLDVKGKKLDFSCSGASNGTMSGDFSDKADLDLSGASKMTFTGNSKEMSAEISGASNLTCRGKFNSVETGCSGASKLFLEGSADNAEYECSGASNVESKNFIVKNVKAALSGASKAEVHATTNLTYMVSKASKIVYYGDASLKNISTDNIIRGIF